MSNSHRESVQRASLLQLQQYHCTDKRLDLDMHISNKPQRSETLGVTSDLRNESTYTFLPLVKDK